MNTSEILVKTLEGKRLSPQERIELSKGLISEKAEKILIKEFIIAQHNTRNRVNITLMAGESRDMNANIRKFLEALGCKKISISSDFPSYCENYEGSTQVEFRV